MRSMEISFTVSGKPRGKGRPRFFRGHAYTPPETREYEKLVAAEYIRQGGSLFSGPVYVDITASFGIPKSWTKAKKKLAEEGEVYPGKPDVDNIAKAVLDGLNGVAYEDDSAVVGVYCSKEYASQEGLRIRIISEGGNIGSKENAYTGIC